MQGEATIGRSRIATTSSLLRSDAKATRRKIVDQIMRGLFIGCALVGVLILARILFDIIVKGAPALSWTFFTERPLLFGAGGGGVAPAIIGTLIMLGVGSLIGIPVGVGTAIYLSEYGRGSFARAVSFVIDLLAGLPSVVIGVFVWAWLVRYVLGGFAGLAGGVALSIVMIPIVTRTVEEMLRLVPDTYREAALGLGVSRANTILHVVLPTAKGGMVTGIVLAAARAGGETAPLLLTALGNDWFTFDLLEPMSALPLVIYRFASSPYPELQANAWGAAVVLIAVIALLSLLTRLAVRQQRV